MKSFQLTQLAFAKHLRAPEQYPSPTGIEDRRLNIYRELIYNNIESLIAVVFPVLHSLLSDDQWHSLVRDFIHRHECQTPYFLEISQEFLQYLMQERAVKEHDPAYLTELAHYEWIELALDVNEAVIPPKESLPNDLLLSYPRVSPLAVSLTYQYPVHKIAIDNRSPMPELTQLVVYRNRFDQVGFLAVNPLSSRLLYLLQEENELNLGQILEKIAIELQHSVKDTLNKSAHDLIKNLADLDIISHFDIA